MLLAALLMRDAYLHEHNVIVLKMLFEPLRPVDDPDAHVHGNAGRPGYALLRITRRVHV